MDTGDDVYGGSDATRISLSQSVYIFQEAGILKRESFCFSDNPLRNVHIPGATKVLQLCLKESGRIAKRRMPEAALVLTLAGLIQVESDGREERLGLAEAVILDPAEEHAMVALEDSVILLVVLPNHGPSGGLAPPIVKT